MDWLSRLFGWHTPAEAETLALREHNARWHRGRIWRDGAMWRLRCQGCDFGAGTTLDARLALPWLIGSANSHCREMTTH